MPRILSCNAPANSLALVLLRKPPPLTGLASSERPMPCGAALPAQSLALYIANINVGVKAQQRGQVKTKAEKLEKVGLEGKLNLLQLDHNIKERAAGVEAQPNPDRLNGEMGAFCLANQQ